MTPENFCYWLQGLLEVGDPKELDEKQLEVIKEHLSLVLTKVTGKKVSKEQQDLLDSLGQRPLYPPGTTCLPGEVKKYC